MKLIQISISVFFVIMFAILPVSAMEMNPPVEGESFVCKFFLTKFLCPKEQVSGPQGPQGPQGESGNATYYNSIIQSLNQYNVTSTILDLTANQSWIYNATIQHLNITGTANLYNVSWSQMNQTPNMTSGPQGTQGIQGIQGIQGPIGDAGPTGPQGVPGSAATVTVNHTFTGATGTDAMVHNVGDSLNAMLDFTIPSGFMNQTPNMTAGPSGATGGTGGQILYFHHLAVEDIVGYEGLYPIPSGDSEVEETVVVKNTLGQVLVDPYVTISGYPGITTYPAGLWRFRTYQYVDSAAGTTTVVFKVYNRTATGIETLLLTGTSEDIDSLVPIEYLTSVVQTSDYTVASTDRIVIKVYGSSTYSSNINLHWVYEGTTHTSHVLTPLTIAPMNNQICGSATWYY